MWTWTWLRATLVVWWCLGGRPSSAAPSADTPRATDHRVAPTVRAEWPESATGSSTGGSADTLIVRGRSDATAARAADGSVTSSVATMGLDRSTRASAVTETVVWSRSGPSAEPTAVFDTETATVATEPARTRWTEQSTRTSERARTSRRSRMGEGTGETGMTGWPARTAPPEPRTTGHRVADRGPSLRRIETRFWLWTVGCAVLLVIALGVVYTFATLRRQERLNRLARYDSEEEVLWDRPRE
ncbi:t43 [Tupaiid betaherpesvirus 1]|uniref:T43 n=1 Tax=Tupaiid herpesvirus 1 (strain 1) TaxID=10397 RepID=Q91TQ0_TUHV1|nr:t43 [Tupaiid betaherpesvirus 1]AAK57087.1 t43 [Tupaiid betaherpesvirus 1]